MGKITIICDTDFHKTPILADAESGKRVHFKPVQVPGKGWSVAKVTGSKRTGRSIERAEGFENSETYTLHQAQMAAENMERDTFRFLVQEQGAKNE